MPAHQHTQAAAHGSSRNIHVAQMRQLNHHRRSQRPPSLGRRSRLLSHRPTGRTFLLRGRCTLTGRAPAAERLNAGWSQPQVRPEKRRSCRLGRLCAKVLAAMHDDVLKVDDIWSQPVTKPLIHNLPLSYNGYGMRYLRLKRRYDLTMGRSYLHCTEQCSALLFTREIGP
jgi:hypothetical protein